MEGFPGHDDQTPLDEELEKLGGIRAVGGLEPDEHPAVRIVPPHGGRQVVLECVHEDALLLHVPPAEPIQIPVVVVVLHETVDDLLAEGVGLYN